MLVDWFVGETFARSQVTDGMTTPEDFFMSGINRISPREITKVYPGYRLF